MYFAYLSLAKDQGRTKEEPRNLERAPKHQNVRFIKIAVSFSSVIPVHYYRIIFGYILAYTPYTLHFYTKKICSIQNKIVPLRRKVERLTLQTYYKSVY